MVTAFTRQFTPNGLKQYISRRISLFLKVTLLLGAVLMFLQERYQAVMETLLILIITLLPVILGRRFQVRIPYRFETLAVIFLYMSLFLGEVQEYYTRFWWWDLVLHAGSAMLLGIVGFLLVYVLNAKKEIDLDLSPNFMALFAFAFAISLGVLWEIFEFAMDQTLGINMQKSGLVDTMWDLIVNAVGALFMAGLGWIHMNTEGKNSYLEKLIDEFIHNNPRFFHVQLEEDAGVKPKGESVDNSGS